MPHAISTPLEYTSSQSDSSSSPGPLTPSPSPSPPPSYAVQPLEIPSTSSRPSSSLSPHLDDAIQPEAEVVATSDVKYRVLYEFVAQTAHELAVKVDEVITVIEMEDERGWWLARKEGRTGWVPSTYLRRLDVEVAVEPEDESEDESAS